MEKNRIWKRKIPLWLTMLILLGTTIGTTTALYMYTLTIEKINLFGGQYQNTQFTITALSTNIKGKNKVNVELTIKNTDTSPHSCTVTVQLLDSNGSVITISGAEMESTQTVTDLGGGESTALTFSFSGTGLVQQYSESLIIIKQTG